MTRPKATILCIDDHRISLLALKALLEQGGYEVLHASDGDEGLDLFLSHAVDAVVLDYRMPGLNGDVVAARMKRAKSHVPIMLLSALEPVPRDAIAAVDAFLCKSQPPDILLGMLQDLLAGRPRPLFFNRWLDHWKSRNHAFGNHASANHGATPNGVTQ